MKEIPLTQGYVALVDDDDYEHVSQFKWCAKTQGHTVYAHRSVKRADGTWTTQKLHRFLLDPPDGVGIDHIDRNGLNNRRENLRLATANGNQQNRRKQVNNTSGYIGVYWHKAAGKWCAQISVNGRTKSFGFYPSAIEAAKARDKAALELYGEFASLNFPDEYYEE